MPEFWAAALALEPGGFSPVTETQYGYHVLTLADRRVVPFLEARSAVARDVADRIEDPNAVLRTWMAAAAPDEPARRAAALAEVRERGLAVPKGERAELMRRWDDQVYQWSVALGFTYGLTSSQIAEVALAALARSGQTADIARTELEGHSRLLRARYEIRVGANGS